MARFPPERYGKRAIQSERGSGGLCSPLAPLDQDTDADHERQQHEHRRQNVAGEVRRDGREERVTGSVGEIGTARRGSTGTGDRNADDERQRSEHGTDANARPLPESPHGLRGDGGSSESVLHFDHSFREWIAYRPFTGNAILAMAIVPPVTKPVATQVRRSAKSVIDISCRITVCSTSDALCDKVYCEDECGNDEHPSANHRCEVNPITGHRLEPNFNPTRIEINSATIDPAATDHCVSRSRLCAICRSVALGSVGSAVTVSVAVTVTVGVGSTITNDTGSRRDEIAEREKVWQEVRACEQCPSDDAEENHWLDERHKDRTNAT